MNVQELTDAGFTPDDINKWQQSESDKLSAAGFAPDEIAAHVGAPPLPPEPDDTAIKKHFDTTLKAAADANKDPDGNHKAFSFADALMAGWQQSVTGLQNRKAVPDKILPEDAPWYQRIASSTASLAGDAPAMVEGFGIGMAAGIPLGPLGMGAVGTGGAFALPAGMRRAMMDSYAKGEIKTPREFLSRAAGVFLDSAKGFVTGVATDLTGGAAGIGLKAAPVLVKAAGVTTAEIGAMTTVSKGLEGQLPTAQDFSDAALMIFGLKGMHMGVTKLRNIYADTGVHPADVIVDIEKNPATKAELLSSTAIPTAYQAQHDLVSGGSPIQPLKMPAKAALEGTPAEQAAANILKKIKIGGSDVKEPLTLEKLYTMAIDDLNPIKAEVDKMTDGKTLPVNKDPYVLARLLKGNFGRSEQYLFHSTYDFNTYKNNGASLADVIEPHKGDLDGLRAFLVANRAVELHGRGIESGFDQADAAAVVEAGKSKYGKAAQGIVDYQNRLTGYLRDSGVIDSKTYDMMTEANKHYVPFYRVMEHTGLHGTTLPGGIQTKNPIKTIKGSERDVIDPLESVIKNTYAYISLAERNAVAKNFIDLASKHGQDFARKVATKIQAVNVSEAEIAKHIKKDGRNTTTIGSGKNEVVRPGEVGPDGTTVTFNPEGLGDLPVFRAMREPLADNQIAVFKDGKREVYEVNPGVAEAFKGTDKDAANFLMRILAAPTRLFRSGTTISPDFMPRNMIRDQIDATINSRSGFIPVIDTLSGVSSLIKRDSAYQDWLKSGGANATFMALDRRYVAENLKEMGEDHSWSAYVERAKNDPMSVALLPWNGVKNAVGLLRVASDLAENSTRLGEFKKSQKGKTGTKQDILYGGLQSREVTLDFARAGTRVRAVNSIIAFTNAQIQGVDRVARAMKEDPVGVTAKIAAMVTMPSVLLWWANHDDPRWKEIPDWQRDTNWIIMTDDWRAPKEGEAVPELDGMSREDGTYNFGNMYRIPKPHETGVLFGSATERFLDFVHDRDPAAIAAFGKDVVSTFSLPVIPQAVLPLVEQFANKSVFTGNPLVPPAAENLLPEYQYSPYTTELSKALGGMIGYVPYAKSGDTPLASPAVTENYIRQWGGGLGMYLLQLADKGLRAAGVLDDPAKPDPTLADIPFIKAFAVRYPSAGTKSIQTFYDTYDKHKKILNSIKALAKDGDFEASNKLAAANPQALATLDGVQTALSNMQSFVKTVYKNPDISPKEKRQLIDTTYYQMISTAKMGNDTMKAIAASMEETDQ